MSPISKINNYISKKKNLPILIAVLVFGIIIILFQNITTKNEKNITNYNDKNIVASDREYENEINNILSKVQGVGEVDVLIVYNDNNNTSNDILNNDVKKQNKITGVIIVCQGADNLKVKSELMNIVSNVLDIELHKVCVLKMK